VASGGTNGVVGAAGSRSAGRAADAGDDSDGADGSAKRTKVFANVTIVGPVVEMQDASTEQAPSAVVLPAVAATGATRSNASSSPQ
jgi:hypothetical protein